jgi:hypothetical protein
MDIHEVFLALASPRPRLVRVLNKAYKNEPLKTQNAPAANWLFMPEPNQ